MKVYLIATLLIATASSANALPWTATTKGPDVFGDMHVSAFAVTQDGSHAIRIQCDNNTAPSIVILEQTSSPLKDNIPGVQVVFKVGSGPVVKASGVAEPWNDSAVALAVIEDPTQVGQILDLLATASSRIGVGLIFPSGSKFPLSFTAAGSTNAIAKIRAGCPTT